MFNPLLPRLFHPRNVCVLCVCVCTDNPRDGSKLSCSGRFPMAWLRTIPSSGNPCCLGNTLGQRYTKEHRKTHYLYFAGSYTYLPYRILNPSKSLADFLRHPKDCFKRTNKHAQSGVMRTHGHHLLSCHKAPPYSLRTASSGKHVSFLPGTSAPFSHCY